MTKKSKSVGNDIPNTPLGNTRMELQWNIPSSLQTSDLYTEDEMTDIRSMSILEQVCIM